MEFKKIDAVTFLTMAGDRIDLGKRLKGTTHCRL